MCKEHFAKKTVSPPSDETRKMIEQDELFLNHCGKGSWKPETLEKALEQFRYKPQFKNVSTERRGKTLVGGHVPDIRDQISQEWKETAQIANNADMLKKFVQTKKGDMYIIDKSVTPELFVSQAQSKRRKL